MSTNVHADLTGEDVHSPYRHTFANAAARLADATTYLAADLNKKAIQLDTNQEYRLSSISPTTWTEVNSPGGSTPDKLFGNGSDGNFTVSVNDFSFVSVLNADTFTLNAGVTIKPPAPSLWVFPYFPFVNETFPLIIRAKTSITINGIIDCSGAAYAKRGYVTTQVAAISTDQHLGVIWDANAGTGGGGGGSDANPGSEGGDTQITTVVFSSANNLGTISGNDEGTFGAGGAINTNGDPGIAPTLFSGAIGFNTAFEDLGKLYPAGWVGNLFGGFQGATGLTGGAGGTGATDGALNPGGVDGSAGTGGTPGLGGAGLILIAPTIVISGTATLRSNGANGGNGGNAGAGGAGAGNSGGGGGGGGGAGGGGGSAGFIAIFADSITNVGTLEVTGGVGGVGGLGAAGGSGAGTGGDGGAGSDGGTGLDGTDGIIIQHELT